MLQQESIETTESQNRESVPEALGLNNPNKKSVKTVHLFGYDFPFCAGHSCRGMCNQNGNRQATKELASCMCDDLCLKAGDCCVDYEWECLAKNNITISDLVINSENDIILFEKLLLGRYELIPQHDNLQCMEVQLGTRYKVSYLAVVSCPEDTEKDLKRKCEENVGNTSDLKRKTPVSGVIYMYKNMYCAKCYGENLTNLQIWQPKFRCQNISELAAVLASKGVDGIVMYTMRSGDCIRYYVPPRVAWVFSCNQIVRTCPEEYITKSPLGELNARQIVTKACLSFAAFIKAGISYRKMKSYQNFYCAVCNNHVPLDKLQMQIGFTCVQGFRQSGHDVCLLCPHSPPSFAILLDYSKPYKLVDSQIPISCSLGQIKGPDEECVNITCGHGFILSSENKCLPPKTMLLRPEPSKNKKTSMLHNIYITVIMLKNRTEHKNGTPSSNGSMLREVKKLFNITEIDYLVSCTGQTSVMNRDCITFLQKGQLNPETLLLLRNMIELAAPNILLINVTTYNQTINLHCQNGMDPVTKWHIEDDITWNDNVTNQNQRFGFSLNMITNSSNIIYISWIEQCPLDNSCPLVKLDSKWYQLSNESIKIKQTGTLLGIDDFRWINKTIYVCAQLFSDIFGAGNGTHDFLLEVDSNVYIQGYLTLVGQSLSMLGLSLTLLAYCLLQSLRTVPGKSIMNLCIALFLSHLLFQINPYLTFWPVVCHVIGSLQHFLWLSSFSWMNCLAVNIADTFSHFKIKRKEANRFFWYATLAWGIPALFVTICVIVDHYKAFEIIYYSKLSCWIHTPSGILYVFAVPLGGLLLLNIILYSVTVAGMNRAARETSSAKNDDQIRKGNRDRFLAYLKLSTIMGFSWIFGFLANFTHVRAFWYLFIVLSSTQGIFIFVSFALSGNVLDQIGRKYNIKCLVKDSPNTSYRVRRTT